jgi:hypothetical protein
MSCTNLTPRKRPDGKKKHYETALTPRVYPRLFSKIQRLQLWKNEVRGSDSLPTPLICTKHCKRSLKIWVLLVSWFIQKILVKFRLYIIWQDDDNKLGRTLMEAAIIYFIYLERLKKNKKISRVNILV